MSHNTGIEASKDLLQTLATLNNKTRLLKIGIQNDELVIEENLKVRKTWEDDYDQFVPPLLEETVPCYIMFRMDTQNNLGYEWLFLTFSPDHAPVRQKMVYAATRSTVKTLFGGGKIVDEMYGNTMDEMSLEGYKKHCVAKAAPPPLTSAEEELKFVKENEIQTAGVTTKQKTVPGLSFPVTQDAIKKIEQLRDKAINYVRLMINISDETIEYDDTDSISVHEMGAKVPSDHARYHLYRFNHTHEGDYLESIVFIYSMPGYGCPVKERMLYSTCKQPVTQFIEMGLDCEIMKKIEIGSGEELTEEFLQDELHPKQTIYKPQFAKPKGPSGRGPKRIVKD